MTNTWLKKTLYIKACRKIKKVRKTPMLIANLILRGVLYHLVRLRNLAETEKNNEIAVSKNTTRCIGRPISFLGIIDLIKMSPSSELSIRKKHSDHTAQ